MRTVGIICEYNPFHKGHLRQLRLARELAGEDCALVCLMSGNFVQRGEPAVFPKMVRAEAALRCGADLVLELPLTTALSSAEGFAAGGVSILTALGCEYLCFGTESDDSNIIMSTAKANLDPAFDALLRAELSTGRSYPAARQRALEKLQSLPKETVGADAYIGPPSENLPAPNAVGALIKRPQSLPLEGEPSPSGEGGPQGRMRGLSDPDAVSVEARSDILSRPNDLLAVEYCKAILKQGSPIQPLSIRRTGAYHAETLNPEAPSASLIRKLIHRSSPDWRDAVPSEFVSLYASAPIHTMKAGERAVLAVLRTLPDAAFQALPFGSEGLWSKFMKSCRSRASVEEILSATKSKRYTRTRIQRMLLCAFLGLTAADLERQPPYVRVLGFTERGRAVLRVMKKHLEAGNPEKPALDLINAGEQPADQAYYQLEIRAADLYSLFSMESPRPAGEEGRNRVIVIP